MALKGKMTAMICKFVNFQGKEHEISLFCLPERDQAKLEALVADLGEQSRPCSEVIETDQLVAA
jgi:hypothetical protein